MRTFQERESLLSWFQTSGGVDHLAASIAARSDARFAAWLVKNARTAPQGLGPHPVRTLQRLFEAVGTRSHGGHRGGSPSLAEPGESSNDHFDGVRSRDAARPRNSGWTKRNAALSRLDQFRRSLEQVKRSRTAVDDLVRRTRDQLQDLQGDPADRVHFAKSLSQVATAVRRTGWPDVALGLLQWAIERGVSDQHVLTDAILCHLRLDDITGAHATLNHARSRRLATDGMYAAVVDAYGRIGNVAHAQG